jgi:hypothetical protein
MAKEDADASLLIVAGEMFHLRVGVRERMITQLFESWAILPNRNTARTQGTS